MTAEFGLGMFFFGVTVTVIGFFIAYKVASYKKEEDLEPNNPIKEFWKDYPGHKNKE